MSAGRVFLDTNILIYMHGGPDAGKSATARRLFEDFSQEGRVLISTQVVQEFYWAGSRKLGLPSGVVQEVARALLLLPLVMVGPEHIRSAFDFEERYKISFWDALIVAAAQAGGASLLYTEDLNDGQRYGDIEARNPFRSS